MWYLIALPSPRVLLEFCAPHMVGEKTYRLQQHRVLPAAVQHALAPRAWVVALSSEGWSMVSSPYAVEDMVKVLGVAACCLVVLVLALLLVHLLFPPLLPLPLQQLLP